jgi:hypothetical protein
VGVFAAFLLVAAFAQDSPQSPVISPHARLMAARSIYIEHAGGRLPNEIIGDAFHGWGRYVVVGDPRKADLIVSISAPVADSGVSVGSSGGGGGRRGSSQGSDSRTLSSSSITQIRLLILDAHDRVVLWAGSEQPKGSMKGKRREDNEVDASLALFRRFRDSVEPEPAP